MRTLSARQMVGFDGRPLRGRREASSGKQVQCCSAIAERPRCRVSQFWPKVEDDIRQTL